MRKNAYIYKYIRFNNRVWRSGINTIISLNGIRTVPSPHRLTISILNPKSGKIFSSDKFASKAFSV